MIHRMASLPLSYKQPENPSETLRVGKKKAMHFQNQKSAEENLDRDLTIKRKGLKRLREKGLKA